MDARNAILTGASHGIGPYIARALAAQGMNLLLVARSEPELARLARELRTRDTKLAVAAIDLAGRQAAEQVAAAATAEPLVFVNSADADWGLGVEISGDR